MVTKSQRTMFHVVSQVDKSAELSECGRYRWWLRRSWEEGSDSNRVVCFVMLNPSTADANVDDPTIRRCIGFAKAWGYNTLVVRNLFPWRATDPKELKLAKNPTGGHRGNNELIAACTADMVVCAWGAGVPFDRDVEAMNLFSPWASGVQLWCLGLTKHGHPRHPLYVPGDVTPIRFGEQPS